MIFPNKCYREMSIITSTGAESSQPIPSHFILYQFRDGSLLLYYHSIREKFPPVEGNRSCATARETLREA